MGRVREWLELFGLRKSKKKIYVFGDSHTAALTRAKNYEKRADKFSSISIFRLKKEKNEKLIGDHTVDDFCKKIKNLNCDDFVFCAVGGNQYAVVSTIRHEIEFSVIDGSEGDDVDRMMTGDIIPYRALRSFIFSGVWNSDGPLIRRIKSSTRARVFQLTPPPPKFDNSFIVNNHESRFSNADRSAFRPTAPRLRLICWAMQRECLEALCLDAGVQLVPPPLSTITSQGYLDPLFYAKDVTHANRRYGERVLLQMLEIVMNGQPTQSGAAQ
jgi:hypothetical protein